MDYTKLRSLTAREIARALRRDGFELKRQRGSHRRYVHSDGRRVTLSFHRSSQTFAIGRRLDDPPDACKDAEAVMVERHRSHVVSLASDVLVAPHHGGNNASSQCFLDAIDPLWVVYSAGHQHGHPTAGAVGRAREEDVPLERIFRTDLGDDEGDEDEWRDGAIEGCTDSRGDDDVELVIREDGTMRVEYVHQALGC